jgi:predicted esterase
MYSDTETLHMNQKVLSAGVSLEEAGSVMLLFHGRGATANDILSLAREFPQPDRAYLAPQAANFTWYPYRFIEPMERNEPWLSSALQVVDHLVKKAEESGISMDQIILAGFSQGACLALEYVVRNSRKYGAVLGFSGGLIGPPGTVWDYPGSLEGTPVFLGCDENDFHIPRDRIEESARIFREREAEVTMKLYSDLGHGISHEEINMARQVLKV